MCKSIHTGGSYMFQTIKFSDVVAVEGYIAKYPGANALYKSFKPEAKRFIQDFFLSKRTLPLTYDPFFKRIFNPDIHSDRLSRLISAILGQEVIVTEILSSEDTLVKGNSLMIMDIVVRLADGSITNVEIQKISAAFPAERMSCYSADLLLRQYEQVKARMKDNFTYGSLNKVYTIVIFENTDTQTTSESVYQAFHTEAMSKIYLHHGKTNFDTGLSLDFLQEFFLISLDIFKEVGYGKDDSELTAWLSLLATDTYEEAEFLCGKYPWMEEIFQEISEYVHDPEEVLGMFSEALQVMDDNMFRYMSDKHAALVKQQQAEIENQQVEIENQRVEIENQQAEIKNQQAEIENLQLYIIKQLKESMQSKEEAVLRLAEICNLSEERASELVENNWNS